MPEGANIEIAHSLSERGDEHASEHRERWHRVLEVIEVIALAVVAIATAWSGFQAAKWDGRQSLLYGHATASRFAADAASTHAGQELSADVGIFTAWLQAHSAGNTELETLYAKRMTPDYRVAFDAWLVTDPFNNPSALPGPAAMPEYKNPHAAKATRLNDRASVAFGRGTEARETADKYVRNTVLLAMVLFLVAIASRFKDRAMRAAALTIGVVVLVYALASVVSLPRL